MHVVNHFFQQQHDRVSTHKLVVQWDFETITDVAEHYGAKVILIFVMSCGALGGGDFLFYFINLLVFGGT